MLNESKLKTAELLKGILADQFILQTKARNYHWNVTGPNFYGLHLAFENIYNELSEEIDSVAERIRALDYKAPGTLKELLSLSSLQEEPGKYPDYLTMVKNIINDYESIAGKLVSSASLMQSEYKDEVTAGILYGMAERYQKSIWMLKSLLEK